MTDDESMSESKEYPENGGGELPDPRKTFGQKMPFPTRGNLTFLMAASDVWQKRPAWTCKICEGRGHIENDCATKKTLDQYAKTLPRIER